MHVLSRGSLEGSENIGTTWTSFVSRVTLMTPERKRLKMKSCILSSTSMTYFAQDHLLPVGGRTSQSPCIVNLGIPLLPQPWPYTDGGASVHVIG